MYKLFHDRFPSSGNDLTARFTKGTIIQENAIRDDPGAVHFYTYLRVGRKEN